MRKLASVVPVLLMPLIGGSIAGRVTNAVTGAGIEGVEIRACMPSSPAASFCGRNDKIWKAVTDGAGVFRIGGIPDGQYAIMPPEKEGFPPQMDPPPTVRVFGDTSLDLQMTPPADVRGRVLDPDGKPAPGIAMKLTRFGCGACGAADEKITDENGEFVFEREYPGSYSMSATPKPKSDTNDEPNAVTTYYPSVMERDQAEMIRVQGRDLSGYTIKLQRARARRIHGIVLDSDGRPVPEATVKIFRPATGTVTVLRGPLSQRWPRETAVAEPIETGKDGTFTFPPVIEGEWMISAALQPDDPDEVRSGATEVTVGRSDIDHVVIRLAKPFDVGVTADWGDSPPSGNPRILPPIVPFDGQPLVYGTSALKSEQLLRLPAFAGRYFVAPSLGTLQPAGYYAAAAMLDNHDVMGQVVELSGPATLKMIYKTGGGSVQGSVENGAGMIVVLLADQTTPTSRIGLTALCSTNGAFAIRDIPPGEYSAAAFRPSELVNMPLAELLGRLAASGKRIRVEAGSAVQADVKVAREL